MQQSIREMQSQHQQEIDALKKQLADQQALIESLQKSLGANATPPLPTGKGENVAAAMVPPSVEAPAFPTMDESVVPSQGPAQAPSAATPNASAFPTNDTSVVTTE